MSEQEKEVVQDQEKYSDFSEGDQYDSDEGPEPIDDKNNLDKKPFKQIQIDYQHFQPISILPPTQSLDTNEDIQKRKIQQYQDWLLKQQLQQQTPTEEQLQSLQKDEQKEELPAYQPPQKPQHIENSNQLVQAAQSTQLVSGYQVSHEELSRLIQPWQVHYDNTWKKNYYYNTETQESLWELPNDIIERIKQYRRSIEHRIHDFEERNMYKFLPKSYIHQQRQILYKKREEALKRPARKQVEESIATKYAYRQGDEEYNVWFDKFLSDGNKYKDRDAALTKCIPEADSGYTKADLYEKFSAFFCLHFARGCCVEGVNCKWYHHVPSLQECEQIDLSKDVFGRSRYQKHKESMEGIGVFSHDTKSVYVSHYKLPKVASPTQALAQMYEILWRHFSQFGDIDDINILQAKGVCFIRFKHRCQAEFAKEGMQAQALDEQEILTVKWANEDPNPKAISRETEERKQKILKAVDKNKRYFDINIHKTRTIQQTTPDTAETQGSECSEESLIQQLYYSIEAQHKVKKGAWLQLNSIYPAVEIKVKHVSHYSKYFLVPLHSLPSLYLSDDLHFLLEVFVFLCETRISHLLCFKSNINVSLQILFIIGSLNDSILSRRFFSIRTIQLNYFLIMNHLFGFLQDLLLQTCFFISDLFFKTVLLLQLAFFQNIFAKFLKFFQNINCDFCVLFGLHFILQFYVYFATIILNR